MSGDNYTSKAAEFNVRYCTFLSQLKFFYCSPFVFSNNDLGIAIDFSSYPHLLQFDDAQLVANIVMNAIAERYYKLGEQNMKNKMMKLIGE